MPGRAGRQRAEAARLLPLALPPGEQPRARLPRGEPPGEAAQLPVYLRERSELPPNPRWRGWRLEDLQRSNA